MAWAQDFSQGTVRLIGLVEILGAAGLVLPMMLDIYPWLTHFAAAGLALLMIGAAGDAREAEGVGAHAHSARARRDGGVRRAEPRRAPALGGPSSSPVG